MQLHLVSMAQRNYLAPLLIMLVSLRKHLRPGWEPVLHLIGEGLTTSDWENLNSLLETRAVAPPESMLARVPVGAHYPKMLAFNTALGELFAGQFERGLFIDADMLVRADLVELYEMDLGDAVLAAARDVPVPTCGSLRGVRNPAVPRSAAYFNAGLMLFEPARWCAAEVFPRSLEYLDTWGVADFYTQETLNGVLWDSWLPLDSRWNDTAGLARLSGRHDAHILHFSGYFKPWRMRLGGPQGEEYAHFMKLAAQRYPGIVMPSPPTTVGTIYDRFLRPLTYPLEHAAWQRGWI